MSTPPTSQTMCTSVKQILRRLCSSTLNSIVVFRRRRNDLINRPILEETEICSRRRALQTSIVAIDVAVSIAETVPVFGPSLKGSLEALWKVLALVEQRYRNTDDVFFEIDRKAHYIDGDVGQDRCSRRQTSTTAPQWLMFC